MSSFSGAWENFKAEFFGDETQEQARADLHRVITSYVLLRETCHNLNQARRQGLSAEDPLSYEAYADRMREEAVRPLIDAICAADPSFRVLLPGGALLSGSSCIDIVTGPDNGFQEWRQRSNLVAAGESENGYASFGVGPLVLIVVALAIVAIGGSAYAYLSSMEGRSRLDLANRYVDYAEQLASNGNAILGVDVLKGASVGMVPSKGLLDSVSSVLGSIGIVGAVLIGGWFLLPVLKRKRSESK